MWLPRPYPDEILGSVLLRACRHRDKPLSAVAREVWGEVKLVPLILVGFLPTVARLTGMDADELLQLHTLFPYMVAYSTLKSRADGRAAALDPRQAWMHVPPALANRDAMSRGAPRWRYCARCAQRDIRRFGESYWHRLHLLPTTLVCPRHKCSLVETTLELGLVRPERRVAWLPCEIGGSRPDFDTSFALRLKLAKLSQEALAGETEAAPWFERHRQGLLRAGYEPRDQRVLTDFASYFQRPLLRRIGVRERLDTRCMQPLRAAKSLIGGWPGWLTPTHVLFRAFTEAEGHFSQ